MTTITPEHSAPPIERVFLYIPGMDGASRDETTEQPVAAKGQRILVVDDQETIRLTVSAALERDGFAVDACADGATAVERIATDPPALVILDVGLPGVDGLAVLREIRRASDLPVVMLTARDEEFDRVLGLELGADDYVAKPFSSRELVARVKSVLRRSTAASTQGPTTPAAPAGESAPGHDQRLVFGDLVIDLMSREVWAHGTAVDLTRREFDLLALLAGSPRQVFSREQLLRGAWDSSADWQAASTVTEHIRRLRQKLEDDPQHPRLIMTVRGVGYRFLAPSEVQDRRD